MLKGVKQLWPSSSSNNNNNNPSSAQSPSHSPSHSFSAFGGPPDQATPRASAHPQTDPFDAPQAVTSPAGLTKSAANLSLDPKRTSSPAGSQQGLRTPVSHGFASLPLATPGAGQPTTGVTVGDSVGASGGIGFGLHEPPKMRKAMTHDAQSTAESADASTENSQANLSHTSRTTGPKGTLRVKVISARGLAVSHSPGADPQPYVVIQFEKNEYVSRPPHPVTHASSVPFTTSTPQPIGTPNNLTRSSSGLGVGAISRAFADAVGRSKKKEDGSGSMTPKAEEPSGGSWLGKPGPGDPVWKEEVSFDVTSSKPTLHLSVYDRNRDGEGFLGMLDIKPVLQDGYVLDNWYKLDTRGDETVTGEVWIQMTYTVIRKRISLKPSDFEFLKLIGRGTFGRVFQVRKKDTRRIYAMKVLSKKEIVAKKEVAHTIGERKILQCSLECPFLVGLKFSFQTDTELYFVTDYKCGGELFWHLQKEGRFSEDRARFYIAELVLALEHLHKYNIVYRDLKPENILLDATGHVALCDFGLSKPDLTDDKLTNTFCGTTDRYLAPEVLLDEKGYGKHVDFWSLGVLLFEMCCGWSPFYAEQTQEMYRLICYGKIRFPKNVIGDDGKQFVKGLLNRNPQNRLGSHRGVVELKEHPFFKNIDWDLLYKKQITPPFKPIVDSDESVANFDPEFTNSSLLDAGIVPWDDVNANIDPGTASQAGKHSYLGPGAGLNGSVPGGGVAINKAQRPGLPGANGSPLTSSVQENFRGFTYTGESLMPQSMLADHSMDSDSDNENAVDDDEDDDEDEEEYEEDDDEEGGAGSSRRECDVDMD
ncbi:AGC/AKT protein kinase [Cryptococcus gattii Ru294]|uniref:Protein kinase Sch9, putative n=2 Tax=Cryptococcus gattii TaxID=37769 RepID=E6RFT6_CRYGW|nr:Protein kinase Sch9, putative [Cryptococcus gattii WM276]ADV25661.1 Protein kinase Sch9, putative [Cryptococcus gattii WM276]KIR52950.1 AGC/AKT protein kinase [Cryptococcus gattii Ru294]KIR78182.1 AGC/AKT protein kinase [Cryptococcus gattii EJB2]KIY32753.1 AGC/AKT protein kinase [Cryptococcus gattii E566]